MNRIRLAKQEEKLILKALQPYLSAHPKARLEMYRRGKFILRIRIIDPDFAGMDRIERDNLIWSYLDQVPGDITQDITMLLLLTPAEASESFTNQDFEKPLPLEVK